MIEYAKVLALVQIGLPCLNRSLNDWWLVDVTNLTKKSQLDMSEVHCGK